MRCVLGWYTNQGAEACTAPGKVIGGPNVVFAEARLPFSVENVHILHVSVYTQTIHSHDDRIDCGLVKVSGLDDVSVLGIPEKCFIVQNSARRNWQPIENNRVWIFRCRGESSEFAVMNQFIHTLCFDNSRWSRAGILDNPPILKLVLGTWNVTLHPRPYNKPRPFRSNRVLGLKKSCFSCFFGGLSTSMSSFSGFSRINRLFQNRGECYAAYNYERPIGPFNSHVSAIVASHQYWLAKQLIRGCGI